MRGKGFGFLAEWLGERSHNPLGNVYVSSSHLLRFYFIFLKRESGEIFFEICRDNRRDSETLEEIILRRVRPFVCNLVQTALIFGQNLVHFD